RVAGQDVVGGARLHLDGAPGRDVAKEQDSVPLRAGQARVQRVAPLRGPQDRQSRRRVGGPVAQVPQVVDQAEEQRLVVGQGPRGVGAAAAARYQRRVDVVRAVGGGEEEGAVAV